MNAAAQRIIARLGLERLPREDGFFRQSWVSRARLANGRAASSAIWYLLTPESFSALHRLQPEELWHFHAGDPVEHVQLGPSAGEACVTVLGPEVLAGHVSQLVVPGGRWQGARIRGVPVHGWSLVGCTVTPAWDEREFELGQRDALRREFPGAGDWIGALTR